MSKYDFLRRLETSPTVGDALGIDGLERQEALAVLNWQTAVSDAERHWREGYNRTEEKRSIEKLIHEYVEKVLPYQLDLIERHVQLVTPYTKRSMTRVDIAERILETTEKDTVRLLRALSGEDGISVDKRQKLESYLTQSLESFKRQVDEVKMKPNRVIYAEVKEEVKNVPPEIVIHNMLHSACSPKVAT